MFPHHVTPRLLTPSTVVGTGTTTVVHTVNHSRRIMTPSFKHRFISTILLLLLFLHVCSASPLPQLYGRGSSLAAPTYQDSLFAYAASGQWGQKITTAAAAVAVSQTTAGNDMNGINTSGTLHLNTSSGGSFSATFISSGSGDGKTSLINGLVDFAGSDSAFSAAQFQSTADLQMIPTLAAAVTIIYNLPELDSLGPTHSPLILDRTVLPLIFSGNITWWNDSAILALQSAEIAAALPAVPIRVVVRKDSSGTSNIFSRGLSSFSAIWAAKVGYADLPPWPFTPYARGNLATGMTAIVGLNTHTIGYAALGEAHDVGLSYASIINVAGVVVEPTSASMTAALSEKGE